jgi:hypothetical protein
MNGAVMVTAARSGRIMFGLSRKYLMMLNR